MAIAESKSFHHRYWVVLAVLNLAFAILCFGGCSLVNGLIRQSYVPREFRKKGWTRLHYAAYAGNNEDVRKFLDEGMDVDAPDNHGHTALVNAVCSENVVALKLFICSGADVNSRNDFKWTPLVHAAYRGLTEISGLLIDEGADVNARTKGGDTPLHHAVNTSPIFIELLVASGANLDAINDWGLTPLHEFAASAPFYDSKACIWTLLNLGADKTAKDNDGRTPYDCALEIEAEAEILELLKPE